MVLTLAGCASPPAHDAAVAMAVPARFKQANLATPAPVPDTWWQLYNDPVLNELQGRLVLGNENLKSAAAAVAAARAALEGSQASQLPTVSAGLTGTPGTTKTYQATANAAWEVDLWGRLSQASDANQARYQASRADLDAARLSAQATLTQTYFALRNAQAQQAVIERSITAYQRSLELTQVRVQAGVAPPSDVLQARTQVRNAQVQALEARNQRSQYENAIAVLLGLPPAAFSLAEPAQTDSTRLLPSPPAVPELLPATLLQRRPDLRAAEQRVAAAYAQIGVADAAFFPTLTLSASGGARQTRLADLFNQGHLVWSVGSALTQKLFDGGATRAASAQARATADQAGATYRQTVLTALQEVEDNLVLANRLQTEAALQQDTLDNARRNLEITQDQYRVGTVSYLNVVTAQTSALSSERTLLDLRARQLNATNQLLKNIAGRWEVAQP